MSPAGQSCRGNSSGGDIEDLFTDANKVAWQATLEGQYGEALRLFDDILERRPATAEFNNRGTTRLLVGDLEGAYSDFLAARRLRCYCVSEMVGVALWLQGKPVAACEDWASELSRIRSGEITHCEPETGTVPPLLWWASAYPDLERWRWVAVEALRRYWRRKRTYWARTITGFLLGRVSESEMLAAATQGRHPVANARYLCRAYFYAGAMAVSAGDRDGYREQLRRAITTAEPSVILEAEYHLARAALMTPTC
jgi:hypothetical protein